MKNKSTRVPSRCVKAARKYRQLRDDINKCLNELETLMATPDFEDIAKLDTDGRYTGDIYGDYYSFVQSVSRDARY